MDDDRSADEHELAARGETADGSGPAEPSILDPGTGDDIDPPADPSDAAAPGFVAIDDAAADEATEHLRSLVVYLAANLTDDPEAVEVVAERRGPIVHLTLRVPEEELGKVIGRQGRIARAMRTALAIAGSRQNLRATLDIDD